MLLTFVWRLQDLVPVLGRFRLTVLASLAALGFFLLNGVGRAPERLRHPVFRWVLAILALAALSVPAGVYPGYSFRFITQDHVKTVLFAVILAAAVRSARDVERFMAVHVAGATLYCLTVLARYDPGGDGRLGGLIYYDANDLAMVLVCTVPMLVYLARPGRPTWLRLAMVPVLGLFALTIVQTGSRGGFLGLLAVFAAMIAGFHAVPRAQRFGVAAVLALGLLVAGNDQFWGRLSTLLNPSSDYNWSGNSANGRMEVWKRGVGYMLDHPVLGVGAAAFGAAEGRLSPMAERAELTGRGYKWSAAHNSFVQIGAELGFPGLIAFCLLLWAAFAAARRLSRSARGERAPPPEAALGQAFVVVLVGYCVSGFFLSQAYSAYLYSVLALLVGLEVAVARARAVVPIPVAPADARAPRARRRPIGRGGLVVGAPSAG
jgi:hypothetical protein